MSAATHNAARVASINIFELTTQGKLFRSYPEGANYLLMKFANDQAVAKMDSTILCYPQPPNMTYIQYADDLYAKSCKVVEAYEEAKLATSLLRQSTSLCATAYANIVPCPHMRT